MRVVRISAWEILATARPGHEGQYRTELPVGRPRAVLAGEAVQEAEGHDANLVRI